MRILVLIGIIGFLGLVAGHGNPCPQHWHYVDNDGEIEGRITFKKPAPADEYHVILYLSVKGSLKTEHPGSIELGNTDLKSDLSKGEILWFKVKFPQQRPIPVLVGLKLNDVVLCQGEQAHGSVVTSIKLEKEIDV